MARARPVFQFRPKSLKKLAPGVRPGIAAQSLYGSKCLIRIGIGKCQSIIQKASELPAPAWVLQFPERLGFDLADTLARDRELLADFLERVVGVHTDAEAHAQHTLLARGEGGEYARRRLAQVALDGGVERQDGV